MVLEDVVMKWCRLYPDEQKRHVTSEDGTCVKVAYENIEISLTYRTTFSTWTETTDTTGNTVIAGHQEFPCQWIVITDKEKDDCVEIAADCYSHGSIINPFIVNRTTEGRQTFLVRHGYNDYASHCQDPMQIKDMITKYAWLYANINANLGVIRKDAERRRRASH